MSATDGSGLTPQQEERLIGYFSGTLSAREREEFETEALADDRLARAIYSEQLLASLPVAEVESRESARTSTSSRPVRPTRPNRGWRFPTVWWPIALGATAAVAFLVLRGPREDAPIFRGDREVATPLAPRGLLPSLPDRFVWTRVPDATGYRIRVFDADARVVGDAATADTFLVAGRWIDLDALRTATWTVTPEAPGKTFRVSVATPFQLPH